MLDRATGSPKDLLCAVWSPDAALVAVLNLVLDDPTRSSSKMNLPETGRWDTMILLEAQWFFLETVKSDPTRNSKIILSH